MTTTSAAVWRIESAGGARFVEVLPDGTYVADPDTERAVTRFTGRPVEIAPMGTAYTPTGPDDRVWLFLLARYVMPAPVTVHGDPPDIPQVPAGEPGTVH